MTRQHYHVVENTPGYMPEDDSPAICTSRREAEQRAAELGRQLRDEGYRRISGSASGGLAYYETSDKMYDLGRVVEIIPCRDTACEVRD